MTLLYKWKLACMISAESVLFLFINPQMAILFLFINKCYFVNMIVEYTKQLYYES